ncbi:MAG: hypothetical protein ABSE51_20020 [Terracidiphilus sp.]
MKTLPVLIAFAAAWLVAPIARCQSIDEIATKYHAYHQVPKLDKSQWALLAADASIHALDAYSTVRAQKGPNHELLLPEAVAKSSPAMYSVASGDVLLEWYIARRLTRAGHRRLARAITSVDIGVDGAFGVHNMTLPITPQGGR